METNNMSFKYEHKKLNSTGIEALHFWENNKNESYKTHASFAVMKIINKFLESKKLDGRVFNGTNPKNHNIAFLVYSGQDADFDFEGRVEWIDGTGHNHLIETLELLGINCHE